MNRPQLLSSSWLSSQEAWFVRRLFPQFHIRTASEWLDKLPVTRQCQSPHATVDVVRKLLPPALQHAVQHVVLDGDRMIWYTPWATWTLPLQPHTRLLLPQLATLYPGLRQITLCVQPTVVGASRGSKKTRRESLPGGSVAPVQGANGLF